MLGDALVKALGLVIVALNQNEIPYALIGGLGAMLRGRIRNTRDCDILALVPGERLPALRETLRNHGFAHRERSDKHKLEDVVLYRFWYAVGESGFSLSVDLQAGEKALHREVVARAAIVVFLGLKPRVATREDLILLKLSAWRPIDRADALDLANLPGATLDADYLQHWANELGVSDRLAEVREPG